LSDKFDITKHKNYKYLSDFDDKNTFDIAAFVSTRLKVKNTDEYAVFNYAEPEDEIPEEAYADFGRREAAEVSDPVEPDEQDGREYEEDYEAL
jgi:hypothetical protein